MMILLIALFCLIPMFSSYAVTYYVGQGAGDADSNSCTTAQKDADGSRKRTIQNAIDNCGGAGNTIIVRAGTYNERLTITQSGSSGSPFVIQGTRSGSSWLSIINANTTIANDWVLATDSDHSGFSGKNIYKKTIANFSIGGNSYPVCGLYINNEAAARIRDEAMASSWIYSTLTGFQMLMAASGDSRDDSSYGITASPYWEGIEATFGPEPSSPTKYYLRLRNGANPNTLGTLSIAPGPTGCNNNNPSSAASILMNAVNYVTLRDFDIVGGVTTVLIKGGASNNQLVSNRIRGGNYRVILGTPTGEPSTANNVIDGNTMEAATYGYGPNKSVNTGAWEAANDAAAKARYNIYFYSKYVIAGSDGSESVDNHITSWGATGSQVRNNTFNGGINGFHGWSNGNFAYINNNTFSNLHENMTYAQGTDFRIYDNSFTNIDIPWRWQGTDMNWAPLQSVYFFRNTIWNPGDRSYLMYFHLNGVNQDVLGAFNIYHNSFVGGAYGIVIANASGFGFPNTLLVDNIIQGGTSYQRALDGPASTFCSTASKFGGFDYNWTYGSVPTCAWTGGSNIASGSTMFSTGTPPVSWSPTASAQNVGLNIASSFTVNSRSYAALPGFSPGYFTGSRPNIGAVQAAAPVVTVTITAPTSSNTFSVSTATITLGGNASP